MWAHNKEVPQRNENEYAITLLNDTGIRQRDEMSNEFSAGVGQEEWNVKGG